MNVHISKGIARGVVAAPPSKSIAHRSLICAGLSSGFSTIRGIAPSDDVLATLDCLKSIGARFTYVGNTVTMNGADVTAIKDGTVLNCRESGSTLRFLIPLCLISGAEVTFTGSKKLLSRPLSIYKTLCREKGFDFLQGDDFVKVKGVLTPDNYKVAGNVSSQFISGLLFALPLLGGDSTISISQPIESRSYIELTLDALTRSGIKAGWKNEKSIKISGGAAYKPIDCFVEGDHSNAAFLSALNVLGGNVTVTGLNEESVQGDRVYGRFFEQISLGTPCINISDCPDLGPVLFALAASKSGGVFTGTRRLKIKESDRASVMAEELRKFGVSVTVGEDDVVIFPTEFHSPDAKLCGHNDHRIVMALATLLTLFGGEIEGAEAVAKSFPDYFDIISSLGIEVNKYEA